MGKKPADRVKTLLGKLDSVRRTQERGSSVSRQSKSLSRKFAGQVEKIFKNLPKPLEWRSFYRHDLPLLIDFCEEVQEVSIQHHLNKSQTRALEKLKAASEQEFQRVTVHAQRSPNTKMGHVNRDFCQTDLKDLSGREIEEIAEKKSERTQPGSCKHIPQP
jgi:hypothetical protein